MYSCEVTVSVFPIFADRHVKVFQLIIPSKTVGFQPQLITLPKLYQLISPSQLSVEFGGKLSYEHDIWLDNRLQYERFLREAKAVDADLDVQMGQVSGYVVMSCGYVAMWLCGVSGKYAKYKRASIDHNLFNVLCCTCSFYM